MKLIEFNKKHQYAWFWKFLVNWSYKELSLEYYPDYENREFGIDFVYGKSGFQITVDWV